MNSFTLLTILIIASVSTASNIPSPYLVRVARIVNGDDANEGEFPSQVSLQYRGSHKCGASILSSDWILTGAQCVDAFSGEDLSVLAGTNQLDKGGSIHKVEISTPHPEFSFFTAVNDIAVLKVSPPITIDEFRQPVKLPHQNQKTEIKSPATVIGWGETTEDGEDSNTLKKVDIFITDHTQCVNAYEDFIYHVHNTQICAGFPGGGKGDCYDDAGGPLFVEGQVIGLTSWSDGCADPGKPSVYTQVSSYRSWIKNQTGV